PHQCLIYAWVAQQFQMFDVAKNYYHQACTQGLSQGCQALETLKNLRVVKWEFVNGQWYKDGQKATAEDLHNYGFRELSCQVGFPDSCEFIRRYNLWQALQKQTYVDPYLPQPQQ